MNRGFALDAIQKVERCGLIISLPADAARLRPGEMLNTALLGEPLDLDLATDISMAKHACPRYFKVP